MKSFYLKDLYTHLILREELDDLTYNIDVIYTDMNMAIAAFLKSLYEQKHAFYFRRIREWHEFHQVNLCIHSVYAANCSCVGCCGYTR